MVQDNSIHGVGSPVPQENEVSEIGRSGDLHDGYSLLDHLWQDTSTSDITIDDWLPFSSPQRLADAAEHEMERIDARMFGDAWPPTSDFQVFGSSSKDPERFEEVSALTSGRNLLIEISEGNPRPASSNRGPQPHQRRRVRSRPYVCDNDECNKSFEYPKDLRRHRKIHDESSRDIMCPVQGCLYAERGFRRQDAMARHMRTQHRTSTLDG